MAIGVVQHAAAQGSSANLSVTLTSTPTQGNLLVAIAQAINTPTLGTGWTQVTVASQSFFDNCIAYKYAGASESTTQTPFTQTAGAFGCCVWELSGTSTTSPIDTFAAVESTAASPPAATLTASVGIANELALMGFVVNETTTGTATLSNSATVDESNNATNGYVYGHLLNPATGSNSFTGTFGGGSSHAVDGALVYIRPAVAPQTLFLRATRSAVCNTATVELLSTTPGTATTSATTVTNAKNTGTWQFIPATSGNTTHATADTFNNDGWIFDGSQAGTYAAGNWTVSVEQLSSGTSGTANITASLYVVTVSGTTVTEVSEIGTATCSNFTNSTTRFIVNCTISGAASVTLTSGQYLYLELWLTEVTAGSGNTQTEKIVQDGGDPTVTTSILTPNFTVASSGSNGTLSITLGNATVSSAGTNLDHGTASVTLGNATVSASASHPVHGSTASTLGAATITAAGTNFHKATAAVTLANATESASGTNLDHGSAAVTLANATVSATATHPDKGTESSALASVTISATATHPVHGTLAKTLSASIASAGTVPDHGALSKTLDNATISASGTFGSVAHGTLNVTLGNATVAASGTNVHHATANIALPGATVSASVTHPVDGTASVVLGSASITAGGTHPVHGTLSQAVAASLSSAGAVIDRGALAEALGNASISATGAVNATIRQGVLALTLDDCMIGQLFVPLTVTTQQYVATEETTQLYFAGAIETELAFP